MNTKGIQTWQEAAEQLPPYTIAWLYIAGNGPCNDYYLMFSPQDMEIVNSGIAKRITPRGMGRVEITQVGMRLKRLLQPYFSMVEIAYSNTPGINMIGKRIMFSQFLKIIQGEWNGKDK